MSRGSEREEENRCFAAGGKGQERREGDGEGDGGGDWRGGGPTDY